MPNTTGYTYEEAIQQANRLSRVSCLVYRVVETPHDGFEGDWTMQDFKGLDLSTIKVLGSSIDGVYTEKE